MVVKLCSVEGCEKKFQARGLCSAHYARARKLGTLPDRVVLSPVCSIEGCSRPRLARSWCSAHYKRWKVYGDPTAGRDAPPRQGPVCTVEGCGLKPFSRNLCSRHSAQERLREAPQTLERRRRYDEQNGCCALCRSAIPWDKTMLDHDHSCCPGTSQSKLCGQCYRGVLCRNCNIALGLFGDDIERLMNAIAYLTQYKRDTS